MDLGLVVRGFMLGFFIAAPVGPIGLLVIQRTLNNGRFIGLLSGLGAATADAIYGSIAAFGLTLVTAFLVEQQLWLGVAGGLFLCYLGIRTMLAKPAAEAAHVEARGALSAYASTLVLTLTNPMTILAFIAIFAGAGLANNGASIWSAVLLVIGVFCGSAAWWLLLSTGVGFFRTRINNQVMLWVNRIAGGAVVALGVLAVVRVVVK